MPEKTSPNPPEAEKIAPETPKTRRATSRRSLFDAYTPVALLFGAGLPLISLARVALMLWQSERVAASGAWAHILLQGIRVDIIQLSLLSLPLVLLAPFLASLKWTLWRRLSAFWVTLSYALLTFLEAASPTFIAEYGVRPNRLFVEYLKYPGEILPMLWNGFRLPLVAGSALTLLATWGMFRLLRSWRTQERCWSSRRLWLTWPLIVILCLGAIRSSFEHRPANPALFALTSDPLVNSLILDSAWSVTYALYNLQNEANSSEIYGKLELQEILKQVQTTRTLLHDARPLVGDAEIPTLTRQTASVRRKKPLNLVIILEESLGAGFVASLGGLPVTPEIEKLKKTGWWFEQLYATGTRSVRGIEAVVTGFPPTPAQSTVKLSLAQHNFANLAQILGQQGYESEFIYGGESHFDNMRAFFLANGFARVTDENDFPHPVFRGSWGVSDEDLFNKAHEQLLAKHKSGRPSFTLLFTLTNHSPFEYPAGRIALYEQPADTENNAVKYTDYALGQFVKKARQSDYWKDTVFVVVADHDIRVRGDGLVPIEHFHIPGLIFGADIKPRTVKTVASQIDLPPTLLSLLGVDAVHPMIGRDLTREPEGLPGRAMMQYEQNYAWMEGPNVVVLRPDKPPVHGRYEPREKHLQTGLPDTPDEAMEQRALAHALLGSWLYRAQRYRLPD